VELGAHGKWEKRYKKICDAINMSLTSLTKAAHLVMTKRITVSCMLKCYHNI
jgi:hypothetical protein